MAELWAAFDGTWKVLAIGASFSLPAVEAHVAAAARRASGAPLTVKAEAAAAAGPATVAPRAVLAEDAATACLAILLPLTMGALLVLPDAPPDWVRRRGVRAVLPGLLRLPAPWRRGGSDHL